MSRVRVGLEEHPPYRVHVTCHGCGAWTEYDHEGPGAMAPGWGRWFSAECEHDYCPKCSAMVTESIDPDNALKLKLWREGLEAIARVLWPELKPDAVVTIDVVYHKVRKLVAERSEIPKRAATPDAGARCGAKDFATRQEALNAIAAGLNAAGRFGVEAQRAAGAEISNPETARVSFEVTLLELLAERRRKALPDAEWSDAIDAELARPFGAPQKSGAA